MVERWNILEDEREAQIAPNQEEGAEWRRRPGEGLVEWLKRTAPEGAALMNDGRTSKEMMDELYDDETGLPK
jgi:hypothetical protein